MNVSLFISVFIKIFFLLTPFFGLSAFMSMTKGLDAPKRRSTAMRATGAVMVVSLVIFFFGPAIFETLGITLDAFRIGAGALLFLSAISLVKGKAAPEEPEPGDDIAVVPLAVPIIVGPATIGTLMVLGSELSGPERYTGAVALLCAALGMGLILLGSRHLERLLGSMGLSILMKLTGLILAALSAQLVFTGIKHFLA
ncbi:MarC family protein [Paucidesulfovibrio longus]|uniref:MarC family protein n=1 Tax=Paucidesulfovibrio longus TaxID=889 RepID=UPI0003B4BD54|nr:MarC family protein [Paucidesulfovibrio longus]